MRVLAYILTGVLGGMVLVTLSQGNEPASSLSASVSHALAAPEMEESTPWTGGDLLEMAKIYDQQADELQTEAVRLEQRATSLMLKPHMDPKGFHRTGLMHIANTRWKDAIELRELAAMHRSEGERQLALQKP